MLSRTIIFFCIIGVLAFLGTYFFSSPGYCGLLPDYYYSAHAPKGFEYESDYDAISCSPSEMRYVALGYPAFYLTEQSADRLLPPLAGGVFYPQFLLVNIVWIAALSVGIAWLWERRTKHRQQKPTQPIVR